ncbi:MFS transporter [Piscirickettsia litoralis]|uniref:MFS transporter n=1 Tax=Piscirickettsia litoralis TaxID=1891921 RepID=UPI000981AD83|nr:MFS transporter [Piscirickettsia litoralis]
MQNKKYAYFVGVVGALAGLLFGIDLGVVAGIQDSLQASWNLSIHQIEFAISAILFGAVVGSIISSYLTRVFGRKIILLTSAFIFTVGSIISAISVDYEMLVHTRIFLGLALGMATFTAPLYLSEISPKEIRGRLIALYQLMITIGIVVAYISDLYIMHLQNNQVVSSAEAWRWMLGVVAFPSAIMFLSILYLPRSPRWLMLKGRTEQAKATLSTLASHNDINREFNAISQNLTQKM